MDLRKINKFFGIGFFLTVFFWLPASGQTESSRDSVCTVELRCSIPGLNVWLNGQKLGQTPLPPFFVKAGLCTLRVEHPDASDWLHRDWERSIILRGGQKEVLDVTFTEHVWLGSNPSGASVYDGDRIVGKTPLDVPLTPDRSRFLTLMMQGYENRKIDIRDGQRPTFYIQLKEKIAEGMGHKRSPEFKKGWMIACGAAALVAGAVGIYCKKRADRAYAAYLKSGRPDAMDRHFRDTVTFDKLTSVFYGLGEVSFGVSLFFLIQGHWSQ